MFLLYLYITTIKPLVLPPIAGFPGCVRHICVDLHRSRAGCAESFRLHQHHQHPQLDRGSPPHGDLIRGPGNQAKSHPSACVL